MSAVEQEVHGDAPIALYRLYGSDGGLLYVGITHSPARRFAQHAEEKPWWGQVARKTVSWHDGWPQARLAEDAAIWDEKPQHNVMRAPPAAGKRTVRTFRMDDDKWDAALAKARAEGTTLTAVLNAYLDDWLEGAVGKDGKR